MAAGEMQVSIAHTAEGRLELTYRTDDSRAQVYFESRDVRLQPNLEACIASALLPCMAAGSDLVVEGPVSARFLGSLELIQTIFVQWYPYLRRVNVIGARTEARSANLAGRSLILFSAGVDSFYTLLKRLDERPDLLFIRGFEYPVEEVELLDRAAAAVHSIGDRLGLRVIEVSTNLRPFLLGRGLRWGLQAGGATKITLGQMLQPEYRRMYISAGSTYAELFPWGSHVILDPLWSTEAMEFIFFGSEANRIEKLQWLAQHDWVLQSLRVCNERPRQALNCGRCEKCIRTMLTLHALGALERCPTFEAGLDASRVARLSLHNWGMRAYAQRNLLALERRGDSPALVRALRTSLRRAQRETALRELLQSSAPPLYAALRRLRRLAGAAPARDLHAS